MKYLDFLDRCISKYKEGQPIYSSEIAKQFEMYYNLPKEKALAAVSMCINRALKNKSIPNLRNYQKGIFYKTKETPFGNTKINKEQIIYDKYFSKNESYLGSFSFLNMIGLTTQIPNTKVIVTNKATNGTRKISFANIEIRCPKTLITQDNIKYLQFLDALECFNKAPIDSNEPYSILASYIEENKLSYLKLLAYASEFYSQNALVELGLIARTGVQSYETTFR